ncbi:MAG: acyltransferase [Propionibacteriaceae bacterium]
MTADPPPPPLPTVPGDGGLSWLSWLRVAAMAAVVLIHVAGLTAIAPDARSTAPGRVAIVANSSSRWAVPVFVMMSGTLLLDPARYRGARRFLRRRALRLVPAVVFWHLVYLGYLAVATDRSLDPGTLAQQILTGRLWTALYFFWIVLGLAVVTPLLIGWVATATRRAQLAAGAFLSALGPLCLVTVPLRHAPYAWLQTAWTWWIPYLGYYLLGYALRSVVLRRWSLVGGVLVAAAGSALLGWHWRRGTGVAGLLERYTPAESYYSPTLVLIAVSVFLVARATMRPAGMLRVACRPVAAVLGRRLGEVTLGVFGVHLLVLELVLRLPVLGGNPAADSVGQLLTRCVTVFVLAYLIALVASRLPVLRRVF